MLAIRFFYFYSNRPNFVDNQNVVFETTLLSEPKIEANVQRFNAELPGGERVSVVSSLDRQLHYADKIVISGRLKIVTLRNDNTFKVINYPEIEVLESDNPILLASSFVRQKIISNFEQTLPGTSMGLLLGIVFGIKELLPKEFLSELRLSGVLHVVAASGMNVTMTGGFLNGVFSVFLRRQIAILFSILGIVFYAFLAGLEPSIVRASIMGILVFTASILGRQAWSLVGLSLAAFVMLFIKPNLLFDIGFQLSFMATLGLIFIKLPIKESIFSEGFNATIAAQIATLPIILANFGTYSLYSILANTLVLWTIPVLMVLGGVGALFGLILEFLGKPFLFLSLPLLLYFENIVSFFAKLGGTFEIKGISWALIAGYYMLVLALLLRRK